VNAPTFLFDENFPPAIPLALRAFEFDTHHSLDHLPRGAADEVVFAFLAKNGWYWMSHDRRVVRNPHQRAAMVEAGIGAFILTGRVQRSATEMMAFVVSCMNTIVAHTTKVTRPFVIGISDRRVYDRLA